MLGWIKQNIFSWINSNSNTPNFWTQKRKGLWLWGIQLIFACYFQTLVEYTKCLTFQSFYHVTVTKLQKTPKCHPVIFLSCENGNIQSIKGNYKLNIELSIKQAWQKRGNFKVNVQATWLAVSKEMQLLKENIVTCWKRQLNTRNLNRSWVNWLYDISIPLPIW